MHLNKTTAPRTSQALDSGARCQGEVSICWDPNCFLPMDEAKRQSWLKRITLTSTPPTPPTCIALGVSLLAIEEVELSPKLRDVDHQEIAG